MNDGTSKKSEIRYRKDGTPWTYSPSRNQLKRINEKKVFSKSMFKPIPQHKVDQDILGDELLRWAKEDDRALNIKMFACMHNYNEEAFEGICQNNPDFAAKWNQARTLIGIRICTPHLDNPAVMMKLLPYYDRHYAAQLKAEKEDAVKGVSGIIVVDRREAQPTGAFAHEANKAGIETDSTLDSTTRE